MVMKRRFLLAGVLLCLGCGTSDSADTLDVGNDAVTEPDTGVEVDPSLAFPIRDNGPYRVGYRTLSFSYTPPGFEESREIKLSIWYPTEDTEGPPARYLDLLVDEEAIADASLAPPVNGSMYPVHIHSHGNQGFAGSTNFLMRFFATHGWVVVAPDHTGNTLVDYIEPRPPWMYVIRGLDISESLNVLESLPEGDPLKGVLATSKVVMSGHSFGGYTTYTVAGATFDSTQVEESCASGCSDEVRALFESGLKDTRVVATMSLAGGNSRMFGAAGFSSIDIPVLMMSGDQDNQVKNATQAVPIWDALAGHDVVWVDIAGGCHQLFALGSCHDISDEDGFPIVSTYTLAFARYHLLQDESAVPILTGEEDVSPLVTFLSQKPTK
jgi:predicted dienelactone hydrolase